MTPKKDYFWSNTHLRIQLHSIKRYNLRVGIIEVLHSNGSAFLISFRTGARPWTTEFLIPGTPIEQAAHRLLDRLNIRPDQVPPLSVNSVFILPDVYIDFSPDYLEIGL